MDNSNDFLSADNHISEISMSALEAKVYKINIAGHSLNNFKTFDPTGYTILCRLGETCDGLNYFPATSKIVLNISEKSQSQIIYNFQNFFPNVTKDLAISEEAAIQKYTEFFMDKTLVVQPIGIPGKVYNFMQTSQTYIPMLYTTKAVRAIKTTGATGIKIITGAPLTFVGATYVGAMFFAYCGGIAGNNNAGTILNFTSFTLSRPMWIVETVLNGLVLKPVSNIVGMPFIINGTQEMTSGIGLSIQEYSKVAVGFDRLINSTVFKKTKKIYKIIRGKD